MTINEQALADGFGLLAQATSLAKVRTAGAALQKAITPTAPAPTPAPTPPPIATWKDLVGVCTHLSYSGTPNGASPLLGTRLTELGVRHIRDGWGVGSPAADAFVTSFNGALRLTFVCDPRDGNDPTTRVAHLAMLAKAGVLDTIEGPNEPGGWNADPTTLLNGWTANDWLRKIASLVRADPTFANVKLATFALADTNTASKYQAFGATTGLDYGTTHDYPGDSIWASPGVLKSTTGLNDNFTSIAAVAQANARIIAGAGKPVIATETGFTTAGTAPFAAVTEQQQADLTVQMVKAQAAAGIRRTFLYCLADTTFGDPHEDNFGLLSGSNTVLAKKPAFTAVQALLAS